MFGLWWASFAGEGLRGWIRVLLRRAPRIQAFELIPLVRSPPQHPTRASSSRHCRSSMGPTQRPGRRPHVSGRWGAASGAGERDAHHCRKSRPGYRSAHQHCRQRGAVDRSLQINPGPGCEGGNCAGRGVCRVYRIGAEEPRGEETPTGRSGAGNDHVFRSVGFFLSLWDIALGGAQ